MIPVLPPQSSTAPASAMSLQATSACFKIGFGVFGSAPPITPMMTLRL
jgi:hypothetical protein